MPIVYCEAVFYGGVWIKRHAYFPMCLCGEVCVFFLGLLSILVWFNCSTMELTFWVDANSRTDLWKPADLFVVWRKLSILKVYLLEWSRGNVKRLLRKRQKSHTHTHGPICFSRRDDDFDFCHLHDKNIHNLFPTQKYCTWAKREMAACSFTTKVCWIHSNSNEYILYIFDKIIVQICTPTVIYDTAPKWLISLLWIYLLHKHTDRYSCLRYSGLQLRIGSRVRRKKSGGNWP